MPYFFAVVVVEVFVFAEYLVAVAEFYLLAEVVETMAAVVEANMLVVEN